MLVAKVKVFARASRSNFSSQPLCSSLPKQCLIFSTAACENSNMSNLLEFPPSVRRPANIFDRPFISFAIRGESLAGQLPKVSKNLVLFYAPKVKIWELPLPGGRPDSSLNALASDYVGVNITEPITATGLKWVLYKMLEASGRSIPTSALTPLPNLKTSVEGLCAWHVLGLNPLGTEQLRLHIMARLLMSPGIRVQTMDMMWNTFTHDSEVVYQSAHNYIRHHIDGDYTYQEMTDFRSWIMASEDRRIFFKKMEQKVPSYASEVSALQTITSDAAKPSARSEILEQMRTRRVTNAERRQREAQDRSDLSNRLRRIRLDTSLRSVDGALSTPTPLDHLNEDAKSLAGSQPLESRSADPDVGISDVANIAGNCLPLPRTRSYNQLSNLPVDVRSLDDRLRDCFNTGAQ
jgi:hypothetical protein